MQPTPDNLTPEQIIELRALATNGDIAPDVQDLADIALGHRFKPEERAAARLKLAMIYSLARGPLADLLIDLAMWAQARRFDDDQDPAQDTPDDRLVRAFFRWQALQ